METLAIINLILKENEELKNAINENQLPRAEVFLGPMDEITPWTASADRIGYLTNRIATLEQQLGHQVVSEHLQLR